MSTENSLISEAVNIVFDESSDFIVIGLTGRTGSGCSTSASILAKERIALPEVSAAHSTGNELRQYRIIKNHIESKWQPFEWLQIKSVITRYLLALNYQEFIALCAKVLKEDRGAVLSKLCNFREEYEAQHLTVQKYIKLQEYSVEEIEIKKERAYELYFVELSAFSSRLRSALSLISPGAYVSLYQTVGDNIRSSGRADSNQFNPKKVFGLANTINKVIKSARHVMKKKGLKCYIVIDAIRNPYEAVFLKERYADFFLVAVNTGNENRLNHLRESHKFTDTQIQDLDSKEYPKKLRGKDKYTSQNIQKCIEISDIHINNPRIDRYGTSELASQLAWYVSLMMHPGLVMPTPLESCMQLAYSVKKNSGCISRQVGAVVTDKNFSVKSVGWNNTPEGQVPCLLRSAEHLLEGVDADAYSAYEKNDDKFMAAIESRYLPLIATSKKQGRNLAYCFKDIQNDIDNEKNQVHTRSLHAEENAFLQIAKYGGQMLEGGILFTTASPCELCAKKAYQIGISEIVYIDPYPGIATSHILTSGVHCPSLSLFRGAIGSAYHRLYQPIMPYKDELEMAFPSAPKANRKEVQLKALEQENRELKERLKLLESRSKS